MDPAFDCPPSPVPQQGGGGVLSEIGKNREVVLTTLKECKEKDILKDYIESHEAEVIGIMMALYDKDSYMKLFETRKKKEGILEILAGFVKDGVISIKEAAKRANMSVEDFCSEAGFPGYDTVYPFSIGKEYRE